MADDGALYEEFGLTRPPGVRFPARQESEASRTPSRGGGGPRPNIGQAVNRFGRLAWAPRGRSTGERFGEAFRNTSSAIVDEAGRILVRTVSMLGVDPRSREGQDILYLLETGMTTSDPEVQALVDEYQGKLIGPQSRRTLSPDVTGTNLVNNQYGYVKGDEFRQLDSITAESLARTQERMAALGMLEDYIPGKKDPKTIQAFGDLLFMSNGEGLSWAEMLGELERQKEELGDDWAWGDGSGSGGRERAPFVAPTYLAPDYATLAQTVKGQLRDALGRDPDDSEMALLTAELAGWDRQSFDAEVAAERAEYDAAEEGRDAPGVQQSVDPVARFRESFEQKFAAEIQGIERTEEAAETSENVRGAVSRLSQMSGGMG